jgi:hypothetical protein
VPRADHLPQVVNDQGPDRYLPRFLSFLSDAKRSLSQSGELLSRECSRARCGAGRNTDITLPQDFVSRIIHPSREGLLDLGMREHDRSDASLFIIALIGTIVEIIEDANSLDTKLSRQGTLTERARTEG